MCIRDRSNSSPFGDSEGFKAGGVASQRYGMGVCHDRPNTGCVDSAKKSDGATNIDFEQRLVHLSISETPVV